MKVSLNWIAQFSDVILPPVNELVDTIGKQLGAVETVTDLGAKYQGIYISKVISCVPHENSDHLNVCKIDDGGKVNDVERDEHGLVQVVCGAPNVRAGVTVAWLPPGSTVPESYDTEPFVLEARELRGVISYGMLASPKELSIGDSHDGILLLSDDAVAGADFATTYELDDTIIEIENKMFTHRPDCFGMLGVAREISGILGQPFVSPEAFTAHAEAISSNDDSRLIIQNDIPELVPRFSARIFDNITVGPSPVWLQTYLARVGLRPINNIVDLTNYFMLLTGQPMHAYDYNKVVAQDPEAQRATIVIRHPKKDETLKLLNGKTITMRDQSIVIATASSAIGLGGVMGGASTEVDEQTTSIILESASFNMYSIRKTSMHHGLFSDAVTRFNKGQSPLQTLRVLLWASTDMMHLGALPSRTIYDDNHLSEAILARDSLTEPVAVTHDFVSSRLGINLSIPAMASLLRNVEFSVQEEGDALSVSAPFWRTDIEIREDIVEEVGRLHGFDKLVRELPRRAIAPAAVNPSLAIKANLREILSKAGANEALTYSFVHGNLLDKVGQDRAQAYKLSNALSPDLQYYRLSIVPCLLDKIHANIKSGYEEFALFEIGKSHSLAHKDDGIDNLPQEFDTLALVYASSDTLHKSGAAFYEAKAYLSKVAKSLGIEVDFTVIEDATDRLLMKPFDSERSASVVDARSGSCIGVVGEFNSSTRKNLKLPVRSAGFEISISDLMALPRARSVYAAKSRFPEVSHDVCYKVPVSTTYGDLCTYFTHMVKDQQLHNAVIGISPVDIYQRPDDKEHKQITFRLNLASRERTLTDNEVNALVQRVSLAVTEKFGAELL